MFNEKKAELITVEEMEELKQHIGYKEIVEAGEKGAIFFKEHEKAWGFNGAMACSQAIMYEMGRIQGKREERAKRKAKNNKPELLKVKEVVVTPEEAEEELLSWLKVMWEEALYRMTADKETVEMQKKIEENAMDYFKSIGVNGKASISLVTMFQYFAQGVTMGYDLSEQLGRL